MICNRISQKRFSFIRAWFFSRSHQSHVHSFVLFHWMRLCCTQDKNIDKNIDHLCSRKATILFVMLVVIETSDYITVEAFLTLHLARDFTVHRCFRACLYEVSQPVTRAAQLLPGQLGFSLLPQIICVVLNEKAGRPACQDPGCSSRDLGKLQANPWPSSRGPFTKFYGGRKQTSNDENCFLFLNIDEALRRPNYYH